MRILQSRILFHEKNRRNIPMQKIAFHLNSLQQGGAERVVSNLAMRSSLRQNGTERTNLHWIRKSAEFMSD